MIPPQQINEIKVRINELKNDPAQAALQLQTLIGKFAVPGQQNDTNFLEIAGLFNALQGKNELSSVLNKLTANDIKATMGYWRDNEERLARNYGGTFDIPNLNEFISHNPIAANAIATVVTNPFGLGAETGIEVGTATGEQQPPPEQKPVITDESTNAILESSASSVLLDLPEDQVAALLALSQLKSLHDLMEKENFEALQNMLEEMKEGREQQKEQENLEAVSSEEERLAENAEELWLEKENSVEAKIREAIEEAAGDEGKLALLLAEIEGGVVADIVGDIEAGESAEEERERLERGEGKGGGEIEEKEKGEGETGVGARGQSPLAEEKEKGMTYSSGSYFVLTGKKRSICSSVRASPLRVLNGATRLFFIHQPIFSPRCRRAAS